MICCGYLETTTAIWDEVAWKKKYARFELDLYDVIYEEMVLSCKYKVDNKRTWRTRC